MPVLPSATTTVEDTAGVAVSGVDLICVWSPCATNANLTPRQFGNAKQVYDQHGYCEGVEYAALHAQLVKKPILFVGMPIATPGAISRENKSGNTGSSVTTVSAGSDGVLGEHDGVLTVIEGGTIGTDQIVLGLSLDGGRTTKRIRLGTANSYTVPYFNVSIAFGAGTLVAGDTIHEWHGSAPRSDSADWTAARNALAAQLRAFRSVLLIGDLQTDDDANDFLTELDAYETENERFVFGRASVYDRFPQAQMSQIQVRMTGAPSVTFATAGDTIVRSAGSFVTDGFVAGDTITITGAVASAGANNITTTIDSVTDDTLEVAGNLTDEGPIAGVSIVGTPTLTFLEVGASGDTLTRSRGSWLTDGFRAGDIVAFDGTASNDALGGVVATVTATVLTFGASPDADLANETIGSFGVSAITNQTKAAWMAEIEAEFASVDDAFRISLGAGRCRINSPFSGWFMRRPAQWFASLREYQHDLHTPVWRKSDGPFRSCTLNDANGNLEEWDDRVDGAAATTARFTSMRSWANGQAGPFVARSLTRAQEGSLLLDTHNVAVVNHACTTTQLNTEDAAVGVSLILNTDGTATADSLAGIKKQVDEALEQELLTNKKNEGQRASQATWTPDADVLFNVADPVMLGVTELNLRGTVVSVNTKVRVQTGAA